MEILFGCIGQKWGFMHLVYGKCTNTNWVLSCADMYALDPHHQWTTLYVFQSVSIRDTNSENLDHLIHSVDIKTAGTPRTNFALVNSCFQFCDNEIFLPQIQNMSDLSINTAKFKPEAVGKDTRDVIDAIKAMPRDEPWWEVRTTPQASHLPLI
jgi:hypothetical protein